MAPNDLKQIRTVIREEIVKSEQKLLDNIRHSEEKVLGTVREKITESEERVLGEIGKFVSDQLLPVIDEKADKTDIDRIERKIDNFNANIMEQSHRIDVIESLPTVAHELRSPKKKSY